VVLYMNTTNTHYTHSTFPAAEDVISPKPVQRSTEQARIDGRTSW
jgi:hypothetical protein